MKIIALNHPVGMVAFDHFQRWGELARKINHIIRLNVKRALIVSSPSYGIGQAEKILVAHWKAHFAKL